MLDTQVYQSVECDIWASYQTNAIDRISWRENLSRCHKRLLKWYSAALRLFLLSAMISIMSSKYVYRMHFQHQWARILRTHRRNVINIIQVNSHRHTKWTSSKYFEYLEWRIQYSQRTYKNTHTINIVKCCHTEPTQYSTRRVNQRDYLRLSILVIIYRNIWN